MLFSSQFEETTKQGKKARSTSRTSQGQAQTLSAGEFTSQSQPRRFRLTPSPADQTSLRSSPSSSRSPTPSPSTSLSHGSSQVDRISLLVLQARVTSQDAARRVQRGHTEQNSARNGERRCGREEGRRGELRGGSYADSVLREFWCLFVCAPPEQRDRKSVV